MTQILATPVIAKKNKVSFVIPALNEERFLPHTLQSIHEFHPAGWDYEIIVVDHGSRDRTREIAETLGAKVLTPAVLTIAGLRNIGAKKADGSILVFLDADVTLTREWKLASPSWFTQVLESQDFVTGSKVLAPPDNSFVTTNWFRPLMEQSGARARYLGSAHLIVPATLFSRIGGFDPTLQTGEDYDFCSRASAMGYRIAPHDALQSFHNRFPKGIAEFMRRERWHGYGDRQGWLRILRSKVAMMTLAFIALHLALLLSTLTVSPKAVVLSACGILIVVLTSTLLRFKKITSLKTLASQCLLFYVYYFGRALAFLPKSKHWS